MTGELSAAYKSGSQRARVVTESWGEHNLYCPNCSSAKLNRLAHNTQASDFCCPKCSFWFQLKGQKTPIGNSITDGAYESMMRAIRTDAAPSYYFMHYDLRTWTVRNLLLVPHFAFPPSAIVKRNPLAATARRAGWVGCNFALDRIPVDARIEIISTRKNSGRANMLTSKSNQSLLTSAATEIRITPPEEVREKFRRIKPLKELSITQRGWTLDVLNIVRRISESRRGGLPRQSQTEAGHATLTITNADVYAHERELSQLHPDNRHVKDKIRQQLQVLRDLGILSQPERGVWKIKK
jgi:type II restriction enzyme